MFIDQRCIQFLSLLAVISIMVPSGRGVAKEAGRRTGNTRLTYGMAGCGAAINFFPNDTPSSQLGITTVRALPNTVAMAGYTSILGAAFGGGSSIPGMVLFVGGSGAGVAMSPTAGMTFGTSNCKPQNSKTVAEMEQELYLSINRNVLEREVVRGQGEHLTAMSWLMGCRTPMGHAAFAQSIQVNFATIFVENDSNITLQHLVEAVQKEPYLAKNCTAV